MKKIVIGFFIYFLIINSTYAGDSWLLDMPLGQKIIFFLITIGIPIIIITTFMYSLYKILKKEKLSKFLKFLNILFLIISFLLLTFIFINIKF